MQQAQAGYRVSTGPIKFDDDWPGYFFRGDETPTTILHYAIGLLDGTHNPEEIFGDRPAKTNCVIRLQELINRLNECQVDGS